MPYCVFAIFVIVADIIFSYMYILTSQSSACWFGRLDDFSFIDANNQVYATPPQVEQKLTQRDRDPDFPEGQISASSSLPGTQRLPDFPEGQIAASTSLPGTQALPDFPEGQIDASTSLPGRQPLPDFSEGQIAASTSLPGKQPLPDFPEGQISASTSLPGKQALPDDIAAEDLARQLVLLQHYFQHKARAGSQVPSPTQVCSKCSI